MFFSPQCVHLQGRPHPPNTYFSPKSAETSSHPHFRDGPRSSSKGPSGLLTVLPMGTLPETEEEAEQKQVVRSPRLTRGSLCGKRRRV